MWLSLRSCGGVGAAKVMDVAELTKNFERVLSVSRQCSDNRGTARNIKCPQSGFPESVSGFSDSSDGIYMINVIC